MATIQVRISDEDKAAAEAALKEMGIDMTTAVRMYFKKIALTHEIPFKVSANRLTVNGFTPEFEEEVLKAEEEVSRGINVDTFDSMEDMISDLHNKANESNKA